MSRPTFDAYFCDCTTPRICAMCQACSTHSSPHLFALFPFHLSIAKRIEATAEERKKYKFTKKGKAYFIRLIFTLPGTPKKTKAAASKTKKKSAGIQDATKKKSNDDALTVEGILAEAAALAVRQREAREAQEPAKKKAKAS